MSTLLLLRRVAAALLVGVVAWAAVGEYRAGHCLAEAAGLVEDVLFARLRGEAATAAVQRAAQNLACAEPIAAREPTRYALLRSLILLLDGRAAEAEAVLRAAIAEGERPELTLNLGRALAAQGDEAGARAAFLRALWAAPQVGDTLPRAMRESLAVELQVMEQALREGRGVLPPLPP
jgi:tetratricopeptide (TPR) repeat protein